MKKSVGRGKTLKKNKSAIRDSRVLTTHDLIGLVPSFRADRRTELCRLCFKYDPIIPWYL